MEVTVAKTAGFCFGVKRAVEKVYEQIGKTEKPIYTYGPIIHNEQVVGDLQEKGVEVIDTLEELKTIRDAVVVIRSHGVGKDVYAIRKCRASRAGVMRGQKSSKTWMISADWNYRRTKSFVSYPRRHLITRNFKI